MNMYKSLKIVALFLILLTFSCSEQDVDDSSIPENTEVSGEISVDTIWTLDKSPYIVVDDLVVEREVTLTIKPQVEIRFERDKGLAVKGILIADGSAGFTPSHESELIKFTSNRSTPDMGDWQGIKFDNTNDDKSKLRYINIKYASIAINSFSSSPHITDCLITNNHTGIKAEHIYSPITYNTIKNNAYGINISFIGASQISNNIIIQNEIGVVVSRSQIRLTKNNLSENTEYAILVEYATNHVTTVDARNNWWGTADTKSISEQQIYDFFDNTRLSRVIYIPFATSKIVNAGVR